MARNHALALTDWNVEEDEDWTIEEDADWAPRGTTCAERIQISHLFGSSLNKFLEVHPSWRVEHSEHKIWEDLPLALNHIKDAIEDSKGILALRSEETGELLSSGTTWQRAVEFLSKNALWLWNTQNVSVQAPEISVGPEGSIDLHWESERYELLINIRADASMPAGFYGDDKGSLKIKGTLSLAAYNRGLLLWLANQVDVA